MLVFLHCYRFFNVVKLQQTFSSKWVVNLVPFRRTVRNADDISQTEQKRCVL